MLYPHSVFMYFVWIWEQTTIVSLYKINWLVFITETEIVYCAVWDGSSHTSQVNLTIYNVLTSTCANNSYRQAIWCIPSFRRFPGVSILFADVAENKIQTPRNRPKEGIQNFRTRRKSEIKAIWCITIRNVRTQNGFTETVNCGCKANCRDISGRRYTAAQSFLAGLPIKYP